MVVACGLMEGHNSDRGHYNIIYICQKVCMDVYVNTVTGVDECIYMITIHSVSIMYI